MRTFILSNVLAITTLFTLTACGPTENLSNLATLGVAGNATYPTMPDDSLTPGVLCQSGQERRYPEHIEYCERNVDPSTKAQIFVKYDKTLGYSVEQMPRMDFKIDHYIPLCMGGANDPANLWPQYKDVYAYTDPIEPKLCQLMQMGKMLQADAVAAIKRVKHHLDEAEQLSRDLDAKIGGQH